MEGNIKPDVLKSLVGVGGGKLLVREPCGKQSLMVSWGEGGISVERQPRF